MQFALITFLFPIDKYNLQSNIQLLVGHGFQMIIKQKNTFNITKGSSVEFLDDSLRQAKDVKGIQYFSDCIFNPLIYDLNFQVQNSKPTETKTEAPCAESTTSLLKLDFGFILQEVEQHKKILDNFGVIKVMYSTGKARRLGILVTRQNDQVWISLVE